MNKIEEIDISESNGTDEELNNTGTETIAEDIIDHIKEYVREYIRENEKNYVICRPEEIAEIIDKTEEFMRDEPAFYLNLKCALFNKGIYIHRDCMRRSIAYKLREKSEEDFIIECRKDILLANELVECVLEYMKYRGHGFKGVIFYEDTIKKFLNYKGLRLFGYLNDIFKGTGIKIKTDDGYNHKKEEYERRFIFREGSSK